MHSFNKTAGFLFFLTLFFSCSDDNNLTLVDSGALNVSISFAGEGVSGAKVDLYELSGELLYDRKLTDGSGSANFGKYNSNDYLLRVEAETSAGQYKLEKVIQIVSGVNKHFELRLEEYSVDLEVNVYDGEVDQPLDLSGFRIVLVPYEQINDISNSTALEEILSSAKISAPLISGTASLTQVPVNAYYMAMLSSEDQMVNSSSVFIRQYEDDDINIFVDGVSLLLYSKPSFDIQSVKDLYTSESLSHNYKSLSFDENYVVLTEKDGSTIQATYNLYSGYGSRYLNFYWPLSSYWGDAEIEVFNSNVVLTLYDYSLYRDVVITLK